MREQRNVQHQGLWPGYGIVVGTGLGFILGTFFGQTALGMAFGASMGLVAGAVAEGLLNRKR